MLTHGRALTDQMENRGKRLHILVTPMCGLRGVPTGDSQNNNAEFITKNRYKNRDKGNNCLDGKPNEDWEFGNNCLERSLTSFHPPFNESEGTYLQKFLYISIILVKMIFFNLETVSHYTYST